jgi:multidrug efflux pump subunit AcrA (membrane-fusion protein)
MEITEKGSLEIVCAVPSVWVRWLKPGHIVWVYVDETAKSYEAELVRLGGKVDAGSKTLKVYARFAASPTDLLPGMSGSASIRPQLAQEYRKTNGAPEIHSAPR